MRTNHPGSAALNLTASNFTLLRFSLAILHLCGIPVSVAKTKFACRIETACFPTLEFAEYDPAIIQVGAIYADLGAPSRHVECGCGRRTDDRSFEPRRGEHGRRASCVKYAMMSAESVTAHHACLWLPDPSGWPNVPSGIPLAVCAA